MPELDRGDAVLHFETDGKGPPLLLVAGLMSDAASWAPLMPLLTPHFTVIRVDNRTCGQTRPWDAPVSIPVWSADLLAILNHLGIKKAHVVGHSLGGIIAWQMAQDAPEMVASCLIAGTAPAFIPRNTALWTALIAVRRSDAPPETWLHLLFAWLFAPQTYLEPDIIATRLTAALAYPHAQSADAMERQLGVLDHVDPTPFGSMPPVPMRALLGERDLLVPMEIAIPTLLEIETHVIEDAGHSMHWDKPGAVHAHIMDFTAAHAVQ